MTKEQKNKFKLYYENDFEKKADELSRKIDEVVKLLAEEDAKTFNLFPGWKFFKIKND